MAINISSLDEKLDERCRDMLGESIQYRPRNGAYITVTAHVDYADAVREIGASQLVNQNMQVELLMADAPAKPCGNCRVKLAKRPGKVFAPVNVGSDKSGTHWVFELETVSG